MRKSSIHILRSDLISILKKYVTLDDIDHLLFEVSNKYMSRKLVISNKVIPINVAKFNSILNSERIKLNHKPHNILKTDKLYSVLVDITTDAEEFNRTYMLDVEDGFKSYVNIGLTKIGKNYALNKFKTYKEHIFNKYNNLCIVEQDDNKDLTEQIYQYYLKKIKSNRSFVENYHDFVYCRADIELNNADVKDWINAQFIGFEYLNAYPQPYQLHGEEAFKRYINISKNWRSEARKKLNRNGR